MKIIGKYPGLRMRRNRKSDWIRRLVQENTLSPNDFILPIFLIDEKKLPHTLAVPSEQYLYNVE